MDFFKAVNIFYDAFHEVEKDESKLFAFKDSTDTLCCCYLYENIDGLAMIRGSEELNKYLLSFRDPETSDLTRTLLSCYILDEIDGEQSEYPEWVKYCKKNGISPVYFPSCGRETAYRCTRDCTEEECVLLAEAMCTAVKMKDTLLTLYQKRNKKQLTIPMLLNDGVIVDMMIPSAVSNIDECSIPSKQDIVKLTSLEQDGTWNLDLRLIPNPLPLKMANKVYSESDLPSLCDPDRETDPVNDGFLYMFSAVDAEDRSNLLFFMLLDFYTDHEAVNAAADALLNAMRRSGTVPSRIKIKNADIEKALMPLLHTLNIEATLVRVFAGSGINSAFIHRQLTEQEIIDFDEALEEAEMLAGFDDELLPFFDEDEFDEGEFDEEDFAEFLKMQEIGFNDSEEDDDFDESEEAIQREFETLEFDDEDEGNGTGDVKGYCALLSSLGTDENEVNIIRKNLEFFLKEYLIPAGADAEYSDLVEQLYLDSEDIRKHGFDADEIMYCVDDYMQYMIAESDSE